MERFKYSNIKYLNNNDNDNDRLNERILIRIRIRIAHNFSNVKIIYDQ